MSGRFLRADRCPVCSDPDIRPWKRRTFDTETLRPEQIMITDSEYGRIWDLSRCRSCGHAFADPSPAPEFISSLYGDVEDPLYDDEAEGRARNFTGILDRLDRHRPARGLLFDVGAATGILCDLARKRGWAVDGIDPSAWAVRYAREKYGLRLRQGSFEDAGIEEGAFQAVTMIDLIEHTPRPREAAAQAARILAPGGILCLVTPDINSPAARLAGRRWWHLRPGHLAYFSLRSMEILLRDAGLRIVERRRYAWTFSAHYLLSRLRPLEGFARSRSSSFLRRFQLKLALGDSFEIYAVKDRAS